MNQSWRTMQVMVLLSGFAGLLYQVIWQKYLTIFLGSDAAATALILSGIFLYLSLGYQLIGWWASKVKTSRILIYAYLELGIGAFALISPQMFSAIKEIYWASSWLRYPLLSGFVLTSVCVGIPAFLMGGTIPVLAEGLSMSRDQSHRVHARLYTLNTLGAFVGALVTSFFMVERWGLPMSLLIGAVINIAVFLVSWAMAKSRPEDFTLGGVSTMDAAEDGHRDLSTRERALILIVSFLSGFYVFSFESLIIRLSGVALGSSIYTYGLVVAAFIAAIAIGSHFSERWDPGRKPRILMGVQLALIGAVGALFMMMPRWPDLFWRLRLLFAPSAMNFDAAQISFGVALGVILVVPVALMGMSLPLLFGYLRRSGARIATIVGRLYSINCLGAVLGALIGGYAVYHWLSLEQVFRLNMVLVTLGLFILISLSQASKLWWASLILLPAIYLLPGWDWRDFTPARAYISEVVPRQEDSFARFRGNLLKSKMEKIFQRDDPSLSVVVASGELRGPDGTVLRETGLYLNSKAEVMYPGDEGVRAILPLIASMLAPKAERAAIVGLGGGLSMGLAANLKSMRTVDVVEISPAVVQALPLFAEFIPGFHENRAKANLHVGDAFQVLRRQGGQYDFILCEPTNLWIAGVDKLYTADFFNLIREQLTADGVFAVWIPLATISPDTFSLIMTTLQTVFPSVTLWNSGYGTVAAVASKTSLKRLPFDVLKERFQNNQVMFDKLKIKHPETILGLQVATEWMLQGLNRQDKRVHTVEYPILTYAAARSLFISQGTNLDAFWSERLLRAAPAGEATNQFLLPKANDEVLEDLIGYYKRQGRETSLLYELKWRFEGLSQIPKKIEAPGGSVLALRAVLQGQTLDGKPVERSTRLLRAFQRARLIGYQPTAARVFAGYDWSCDSYPCARLAQGLLAEFLPLEESKPYRGETDLSSVEKRREIQQKLQEWARNQGIM